MQTIYELLNVTVNQPDVLHAILYDPNGRIIHSGNEKLTDFGNKLNDPQSIQAIQTEGKHVIQTTENTLDISVPIWIGESPLGGIKVILSLKSIPDQILAMTTHFNEIKQQTSKKSLIAVVLLLVFFIIFGVASTVFIMLKLTKPVRELILHTKKIGSGDYTNEIYISDQGEIGELFNAFNKMRKDILSHETLIRNSEKKYRHLFNSAPAGIYEIDLIQNKIINVNNVLYDYFGYSPKEFLSMKPLNIFTRDSQNKIIKNFKKNIAIKKMTDRVECVVLKKNGQKAYAVICYDCIDEKKEPVSVRVVTHDITDRVESERKRIKAQKAAANQAKYALIGQVAGKMAHDFNNILGIIMVNAELSMMGCSDKEQKESFKLIFEQTIRGRNLTDNLVAFAENQELEQKYFKINKKIFWAVQLLKKELNGIELEIEEEPKDLECFADPGMIEHTLINLIQNSIHAVCNKKSPKIIFRIYCTERFICFEIEDNGCGIPDQYQQNVFDPSFTLKGSKDTCKAYRPDIKGTGYGMANVKKYIEQHKGNILLESKSGLGTKLTIQLPILKKELSTKKTSRHQQTRICSKKNILVVEDEQAIYNVLYKILTKEPWNHRVDIATSGQDVISLYLENKYDCLSLDYLLLGQMNGMDIYNEVRKNNKKIPILFLSGNIEFIESINELKKSDPYLAHLSKPCSNKEYVSRMNKLLGSSLVKT